MLPYLAFSSEQEAPQQSTGQSIQTGTYSSDPAQYYSGAANTVGGESYSNYGVQQSSTQDSQYANPGDGDSYQIESWSSSSGTGDEEEPDFSSVTDEDQIYAFKSRSRYNQKRLLFSQFRYTPTEPLQPQDPVFPYPERSYEKKRPGKKGLWGIYWWASPHSVLTLLLKVWLFLTFILQVQNISLINFTLNELDFLSIIQETLNKAYLYLFIFIALF